MKTRPATVLCQLCGKIIQVGSRGAIPKYCSPSCTAKASYQRRKQELTQGPGEEMTCAHCGKKFWWNPPKKNARRPQYCSTSCCVMATQGRYAGQTKEYQHDYYMAHKDEILGKYYARTNKQPRPKLTPEERKEKLRKYNAEYQRKRRMKLKTETE
ncbi:MAG: hypothetical protein IJH79_20795 [Lentisphaeria bacterium]|nr:hypothetical protein [Lentisphaeria bacterium]